MTHTLTDDSPIALASGIDRTLGLFGYDPSGFAFASTTPSLATGASGAWDDYFVRDLSVPVDSSGHPVKVLTALQALYFGGRTQTGSAQLGMATSGDGGKTWQRYAGNPVVSASGVSGSWRQYGVSSTGCLYESGTYYLYAAGWNGTTWAAIGLLTSPDLITWTDQGSLLTLSQFQDGANTILTIGNTTIVKTAAGVYTLLFEGYANATPPSLWRIWGATASSAAGPFTPINSGQPLLTGTAGTWTAHGVSNPCLIEAIAGSFILAHAGWDGSQVGRIGLETSTDLLNWAPYTGNPVLSSDSQSWRSLELEPTCLFKGASEQWRLIYNGYNSSGLPQVGLAQSPQANNAFPIVSG